MLLSQLIFALSRCMAAVVLGFAIATLATLHAAAPATPPFRIGLNGVFIGSSNSLTTDQNLTMFKEVGAAGLRHFDPNDVGWNSVQPGGGLFVFTGTDSVMTSSYRFGFLPTFYGNSTGNYYVPPGVAPTVAWSAATYGTQTTTYLQTVVNRYKGVTHYWEIANEMNTKTTSPAGFSAADYATFLIYNRNAIRVADPQAQIVIAGALGNYGYPFANAYQWLRDVLAAGGAAGFDVFNFHDYKSWWTLPTHYDQFRAILDENGLQAMPIWITETAQASAFTNSNVNPAYVSIDGQAADVWRRPCLLFGKGAQTVFWHSFWANVIDLTSGFHDMGIVDPSTGIRKKSWHSMKLLNQKIEGFASATMVSMGVTNDDNVTGGSGAWVVRFDFSDGTKRWVAWSPNSQAYTLTGLTYVASVNLTTVVPASVTTDGLTATWTTSSRTVSSGSLALTLADAPVLIEVATTISTAPTISTPPASQTVTAGSAFTLTVVAAGTPAPTSYQWYKDGAVISGATTATYTVANAGSTDASSYTCVVGNSVGSVTSAAAIVTVTSDARVVNLSVRSTAGTGDQTLIVGFVITGSGNKTLLLRGLGPALTPYGVTNALTDPFLRLFNSSGSELSTNNDWDGSTGMIANFTNVGASSLAAGSKDAALLSALAAGLYSCHVVANDGGTGVALAEAYDADATAGSASVVNISARTQVGTGESILIAGFVITGTNSKTILIRGLGPSLVPAGVASALLDPQLNLFRGSTLVASNDDWGGTTVLKAAFTIVGAGALVSDTSKDAALLVTLQPGLYTAQVSGLNGTTGVGLVELFLLP